MRIITDLLLVNRTEIVYTISVKNITLSAEEHLIEQARLVAQSQHKTLNAAFREWLEQYAAQAGAGAAVGALMRRLKHVRSAGPYSRDQLNERRPRERGLRERGLHERGLNEQ